MGLNLNQNTTEKPSNPEGEPNDVGGNPVSSPDESKTSDVIATYSSSPISNYRVGKFEFDKGLLTFKKGDEKELEAFEAAINHKNFPAVERNRVVKIDVAAAEKLLAEMKKSDGGATQAVDSTVGERVNKPKAEGDLGTTSGRGN